MFSLRHPPGSPDLSRQCSERANTLRQRHRRSASHLHLQCLGTEGYDSCQEMSSNRPSANSGFTSMLRARDGRVGSAPMKNVQVVRAGTQRVGLRPAIFLLLALLSLFACSDDDPATGGSTEPSLSFFVTSVGTGSIGGDVGGLSGADEFCQNLAAAVGAGDKTWHAYLSSSSEDARNRIGTGPWYNARLQEIAADVDSLHENGIPRLLWGATEDSDGEGLVIDENGVPRSSDRTRHRDGEHHGRDPFRGAHLPRLDLSERR